MANKPKTAGERLLQIGIDYPVLFSTIRRVLQIVGNEGITEGICGLSSRGVSVSQMLTMAVAFRKSTGRSMAGLSVRDLCESCESCKGCFALSLCVQRKLDW